MSQGGRRGWGAGPVLAILLVRAGAAGAADPSSGPAAVAAPAPRASLFISPMGEPFRLGPGVPDPVAKWFAQADRNGDGRIDRAEFRADAQAFFNKLDPDHDGVIDGFEVANYEHNVAPEILGAYRPPVASSADRHPRRDSSGDGHRRGQGGDGIVGDAVMGGAAPYELLAEPEPVSSADADLTGRVTLAEFLAAADRRFDKLDSMGLGYLTLDTLPRTPAQQALDAAARKRKP